MGIRYVNRNRKKPSKMVIGYGAKSRILSARASTEYDPMIQKVVHEAITRIEMATREALNSRASSRSRRAGVHWMPILTEA